MNCFEGVSVGDLVEHTVAAMLKRGIPVVFSDGSAGVVRPGRAPALAEMQREREECRRLFFEENAGDNPPR